ncbi:hypothetical protein J3459_017472 [Metarhizium acridum]|nr:hypothetical protein J3459_017472 [Metarhizium acridum]KAG8412395.1 hypothetical protein J3458_014574 [Metarhizium acridum]
MADDGENMPVKEGEVHSQQQPSEKWLEEQDTSANGNTSNLSNDKGKGKSTVSIVDRLQSSGRAIIHSAISDKCIPTFPSSQKEGGESSASACLATHQSISGTEQQRNRQASAVMPQQSFRSDRGLQGTSNTFEAFAAGETPKPNLHTTDVLDAPGKDKSVTEQEALDGSDVVHFLSRPETGDLPISEEPGEMTPSEAARLRAALFGSGSSWPFWDQLLNFSPAFVVEVEGCGRDADSYMGTSDVGLARSTWLRHWNDVLSSYTDEVWGDLAPLATEAKEELQQYTQTQESLEASTTALNRLRLILNHVRGP